MGVAQAGQLAPGLVHIHGPWPQPLALREKRIFGLSLRLNIIHLDIKPADLLLTKNGRQMPLVLLASKLRIPGLAHSTFQAEDWRFRLRLARGWAATPSAVLSSAEPFLCMWCCLLLACGECGIALSTRWFKKGSLPHLRRRAQHNSTHQKCAFSRWAQVRATSRCTRSVGWTCQRKRCRQNMTNHEKKS